MSDRNDEDWPAALYRCLGELGVSQLAYVPDAGHARLLELARGDAAMRSIVLTSEEEGIAVSAGAWLGGARAAVLMQSSGVGNCVNALASLTRACEFPLLMLVTMRGEWGEANPWQLPMGGATAAVLAAVGVRCVRLEHAAEAGAVLSAAGQLCFNGGAAVAVLIAQRLIGAKAFK